MAQKPRAPQGQQASTFEQPPQAAAEQASSAGFDEYDEPGFPGAASQSDGDLEAAGIVYSEGSGEAASQQVMEAKQQVEAFLGSAAGVQAASAFSAGGGGTNIVGVGIGSAKVDNAQIAAEGPGTATLNLYVAEPVGQEEVRAALYDSAGVTAAADDAMPVNVVVTGPIDAQAHRFRDRPAPGGISISNFRQVSAGTLGCLARGRTAPRSNRVMLLTNNHVGALSNAGQIGDSIVQQGRLDGGANPADQIAILERFVTIQFGGAANYVDCATGWCWSDRVRPDLVYLSGGARRYFRVSSVPRQCQVGLLVGKSGRTTQLTSGRITDCNATIQVNYGAGRVALFRDQIAITGLNTQFSAAGDSGSLIWTWDAQRNPVGLLFAGGGNVTFANKIGRVMAALDINLYT